MPSCPEGAAKDEALLALIRAGATDTETATARVSSWPVDPASLVWRFADELGGS